MHGDLELVVAEGGERRNHQFKIVGVFISRAVLSRVLRVEIFREKGNGWSWSLFGECDVDVVTIDVGGTIELDIKVEIHVISNDGGIGRGSTGSNAILIAEGALGPGYFRGSGTEAAAVQLRLNNALLGGNLHEGFQGDLEMSSWGEDTAESENDGLEHKLFLNVIIFLMKRYQCSF